MTDLFGTMAISASGMRVQGERIRVTSENIANVNTVNNLPDEDPYIRQQISFTNELDRALGVQRVEVDQITQEADGPFETKYMPSHPGADQNGYVKLPNVNIMIEMMDAREAQRTYEANLGMMTQTRSMASRTIDLLR